MSRKPATILCALALSLLVTATPASAQAPPPRPLQVKQNLQKLQEAALELESSGIDSTPVVHLLVQVPPLMKRRKIDEAEGLIEEALRKLEELRDGGKAQKGNVYTAFRDPVPVQITGYDDHAMEPFVSRDGRYLFFNNLNDPSVNTDLHHATRVDDVTFAYQGPVQGVNTRALEGVATLSANNTFLFISTQNVARTASTIHSGHFDDGRVSQVRVQLAGAGLGSGFFAMGPEISPDGETLYFVKASFRDGKPRAMDLLIARRKSDTFRVDPDAERLMRNINTEELEYAACISEDGLELFFTRASGLISDTRLTGTTLETFVARRDRVGDPFGPPLRISAITGFAEAPTISGDGKTLYFHKRVEGRFSIFKVTRDRARVSPRSE